MEDTTPVRNVELGRLLARQVEDNRADLVNRYMQIMRETLFSHRSEMRPSQLNGIVTSEIDALISFCDQKLSSAKDRGSYLCQTGLSEQTVLRICEVTRQFFLPRLEYAQIVPAITLLDIYQNTELQGFMTRREELILAEQESIRNALQIAISHYTVEIKEIQEIAQKASEANKFKTEFIARISHELRTPLGALMGMAEMMTQDIYGGLTVKQQEIARRIVTNAQTLKRVFAELLDQSQIESGQLHLKEEEFSPDSLVETVNSNYLSMALEKGLSMRVETSSNKPALVIGDRARIEQILSNLVVNAIKFTRSGGITIFIDREDDTHWSFLVRDTGIGILPEDLTQIFEPFHQVDENIGHKLGGVGLGLSIVKQLVTTMHGTFTVESKIGQGSTFKVILPVTPEKEL
jgi:signal transduction histidine kinase